MRPEVALSIPFVVIPFITFFAAQRGDEHRVGHLAGQ